MASSAGSTSPGTVSGPTRTPMPHATVASVTSVAQISTDRATCSTTAHGRRWVQTCAAPTTIWATKSEAATVESRTRVRERGAIVRARTST